jgi:flavin reductase (DIM6/NTAB) family NADH-FMN oxidoreductase RutF
MLNSIHSTSDDLRFPMLFRRAANFIPTGVAILSAENVAMTVGSLHCVSFDPPMVSVAMSRNSTKGRVLLNVGRFLARLLREGQQSAAKGEGVLSGSAVVEMHCTVTEVYPAGDHDLVLARVDRTSTSEGSPLVYWRRGIHTLRPRYGFLESREVFEGFVATWEATSLPKIDWTHAAHVAVATCYAHRFGDEAFERMRAGILRYNKASGTVESSSSGYHETLTRFWSIIVAKATSGFSDPYKAACRTVAELGEDRDLHTLYYSFDVVRNSEARRRWVPPDLEGPI